MSLMDSPLSFKRLRRTRMRSWSRNMFAESEIFPAKLISPIFVRDESISPIIPVVTDLTGIRRLSPEEVVIKIELLINLGIKTAILFDVIAPEFRDASASAATDPDGPVCRAIRLIREKIGLDFGIIADVALDPYTSHGHDGILDEYGLLDNDATLPILADQALALAEAGCSVVAPSDMTDGRVKVIRKRLDECSFPSVMIFSYAAKYASAMYGPFRRAVCGPDLINDKSNYQLDCRNFKEGVDSVNRDFLEGADSLIIKPSMNYLDLVREVSYYMKMRTISYQVSGEYAMLKSAANTGLLDFNKALLESAYCAARAGVSGFITYGAEELAVLLD